jgi:50S ribosomal protein L16 3-hydroxylase
MIERVAELRGVAGFIPCWRVDDVMVSYANDGGSVGPHFDNYDVFLIQGEGQKLWRIGQHCDENTPLLPDSDLRILKDFELQCEYLLNPGDVLYVPPGVAHWGVSQGESTTFSLGFRAPALNHMLSRRVDSLLESLSADALYEDVGRVASVRPGEITTKDISSAVRKVTQAFAAALGDETWFGELVTEPRYEIEVEPGECELMRSRITEDTTEIQLNLDSRVAWQEAGEEILVYANGEHCRVSSGALPALTTLIERGTLKGQSLDEILQSRSGRVLIDFLIDSGSINVQ